MKTETRYSLVQPRKPVEWALLLAASEEEFQGWIRVLYPDAVREISEPEVNM